VDSAEDPQVVAAWELVVVAEVAQAVAHQELPVDLDVN